MINVLNLNSNIPSEDRKLFQSLTHTFKKEKGDFLPFDGDVQTHLLLIKSGMAAVYDDSGSKLRILDFAYNNRFCVDFTSFSNQTVSRYCIECLSDCLIESIGHEHLQTLLEQSPMVARAYRLFLEKLFAASLEKNRNDKELAIEERFKLVMNKKPELFKLVPHKYIASYANIEETNFSRLYNAHCVKNGLMYE